MFNSYYFIYLVRGYSGTIYLVYISIVLLFKTLHRSHTAQGPYATHQKSKNKKQTKRENKFKRG
jgi:hypothetical protein